MSTERTHSTLAGGASVSFAPACAAVAGPALFVLPGTCVSPNARTSCPGRGSTRCVPPRAAFEPAGVLCSRRRLPPSERSAFTPDVGLFATEGPTASDGTFGVGACPYPRHAWIVGVTTGTVNGETDVAQDAGFTRLSQFGTDAFRINPPARIAFGDMGRGVKANERAYRAKDLHLPRRSQNFRRSPDESDDPDAATQGGYCPAGRGKIVGQSQPHARPQGGQYGLSRHEGGGGFRHVAPPRPQEVERLDRRGSCGSRRATGRADKVRTTA